MFHISMVVFTVAAIVAAGELMLRWFSPVEYISPRYKYSPKYGFLVFENTRMVHSIPGKYEFHYTVNQYGYRGEPVELKRHWDKPNIVVLGDSYSFGMGVNDGEEYPRRLIGDLGGRYNVVNLGNPAWGFTQEVRRYYDFGSLFHPEIVVLQYCSNDPEDNFTNMVTRVEDGRIEFVDGGARMNWVKKYLSRSFLQRSQLYNFFRGRIYHSLRSWTVEKVAGEYRAASLPGGITKQEEFYCRLLEKFAADLKRDGVSLLMIAVNDQLDRNPGIKEKVLELDRRGELNYIEVAPWFDGVTNFGSVEGHVWGAPAHRIIAAALADSILAMEAPR